MAGELDRPDPMQLRVSDADRHRVAELLREAAGEGRLELEELESRLEATFAAKTYADLVPITADLPSHPTPPQPARVPERRRETLPTTTTYERSYALMSETRRQGPWLVPETHSAVALMGSIRLDLREATFAAPVTTIYANAVMAGIDIIIDEFTQVVVDGLGIMGEFNQGRDKVPARTSSDSPMLRVKGLALMGGVTVTRRARRTADPD